MGCHCGGKRGVTYRWVYTNSQGEQSSYASEVEAKSAWLRDSKQGSIQKVEAKK